MNWLSAISIMAALVATGCSAPDEGDVDAQPHTTQTGRYGLILLTHEFAEAGVEVSGQLLAYDAPSRTDALHALAVPVEAWLTEAGSAPGCRPVSAPFDHQGHVDLLSAGPLRIQAPAPLDQAMTIEPRAFPVLRFSLSGVVYDADAPQALPYLAGGEYAVSAPGAEVGEFGGGLAAAGPVWLTEVSQTAGGLQLAWGGAGPAHVVVARDTADRTVGVVCSSARNALTIDAESLRALGKGEAQVVIARLSRTTLDIAGLDAAEAVFISRDTVNIDLVPRTVADEIEDAR